MNSKLNRRYGVHIINLYNLHCLVKGLVELGDLGGNTEVNGTVTDLDDDTTDQIRVDLFSVSVDDTSNNTGIGIHTLVTTLSFLPWVNSDLETAFSRREMLLLSSSYLTVSLFCTLKTQKGKVKYLSTGDVQVQLAPVSTHESAELLANVLQNTQSVVLGQRGEEVLDGVPLVTTSELLEFRHDLLLVSTRQSRGTDDRSQLAVRLEGLAEDSKGPGDLVEGSGFDGSRVLESRSSC